LTEITISKPMGDEILVKMKAAGVATHRLGWSLDGKPLVMG
jgi:Zn-dependent alcohol dehydrogenase